MSKCVLLMVVGLLSAFGVFSQEKNKNTFGIEFLGNSGLYSIVYNHGVYDYKRYSLEIRPQFSVVPGSVEGEIPNNIVTTFGVNNRFGNRVIWGVVNLSSGVNFSWGANHTNPQFIFATTAGVKVRTDFVTIGAGYTYFFVEPTFFTAKSYPGVVALSLEFEIN